MQRIIKNISFNHKRTRKYLWFMEKPIRKIQYKFDSL